MAPEGVESVDWKKVGVLLCNCKGKNKMLERKKVIVPGFVMKAGRTLAKLAPENMQMYFAYNTQRKKLGGDER